MDLRLDRWKKGDKFSASHLNQVVDITRTMTHLTSHGIRTIRTPTGTTFSLEDQPDFVAYRFAAISGPTSGSDYSDCRYWLKDQYIPACGSHDLWPTIDANPPPKDDNGNYMDEYPFTAINLAEFVPNTHSLPIGTPVHCWQILDRQDPPVAHWFFALGGAVPIGQYQYQVFTMVSQNQDGWDYVRAHPLT